MKSMLSSKIKLLTLLIFLSLSFVYPYTLYFDNLRNAKSTGWKFTKDTDGGGSFDSPYCGAGCSGCLCTKLHGYEMTKTFSGIGSLSELSIRFTIDLYNSVVYYKYDDDGWHWLLHGDKESTFTYFLPESNATSLTIKFDAGWYVNCCKTIKVRNFYLMASSKSPTNYPTKSPTEQPTKLPTSLTTSPTFSPSMSPTISPTNDPTSSTNDPTSSPSIPPTQNPSLHPTLAPSIAPSLSPSNTPSSPPSNYPTFSPSFAPTSAPTYINYFEYGECIDLSYHTLILYDITQFECIEYCNSNECR
eukprot:241601_1